MSSDSWESEAQSPAANLAEALGTLANVLGRIVQETTQIRRVANIAMPDCFAKIATDDIGPIQLWDRILDEARKQKRLPELVKVLHAEFDDYPDVRDAVRSFESSLNPVMQSQARSNWRSTLQGYYQYLRQTDSPRRERVDALRRSAMKIYHELEPSSRLTASPDNPDAVAAEIDDLLALLDQLFDALYVYRGLLAATTQATSATGAADLRLLASDLQQLATTRRAVVESLRALCAVL